MKLIFLFAIIFYTTQARSQHITYDSIGVYQIAEYYYPECWIIKLKDAGQINCDLSAKVYNKKLFKKLLRAALKDVDYYEHWPLLKGALIKVRKYKR